MSAVTTSNAAAAATSSSSSANAQAPKPAVQASEVGWLFVTQYYTFLNQNPSRLHCFFTKKSTMVHGTEQEESSPCFGQQQIHDKITSLNFNDAKVFVSNVDTQSSASGGILVQVLGELSNNGAGWRKFAQTFFLAEQPNGYYVLNDIFRYLKDDDEIEARQRPSMRPSRTRSTRPTRMASSCPTSSRSPTSPQPTPSPACPRPRPRRSRRLLRATRQPLPLNRPSRPSPPRPLPSTRP